MGIAQQPEVDRCLYFVALVFRHELEVSSTYHLLRRVAGDLFGEWVDRGDSPLPVQTHDEELDAVEQLVPPSLVGDNLARQPRGANEILRQIPTHGGDDHKERKGVQARQRQPPEIDRNDHEKAQRVDDKAAADEPRRASIPSPNQAYRYVDEDHQKPDHQKIAHHPQWVCVTDRLRERFAPRQRGSVQLNRPAEGDADDKVEGHGQHREHGDRPQQPAANQPGAQGDVPRQGDDRGADKQRGPRHPGQKLSYRGR